MRGHALAGVLMRPKDHFDCVRKALEPTLGPGVYCGRLVHDARKVGLLHGSRMWLEFKPSRYQAEEEFAGVYEQLMMEV